jgi:hypothetical protein
MVPADGAAAHTVNLGMEILQDFFGGRNISEVCGLSCLSQPSFYLWVFSCMYTKITVTRL